MTNISRSTEAEISKDAVVTTFIHIFGCPAGKQELFVFYRDGTRTKVVHLVDEEVTMNEEVLKKAIGDVNGYNRKFDCGTGA